MRNMFLVFFKLPHSVLKVRGRIHPSPHLIELYHWLLEMVISISIFYLNSWCQKANKERKHIHV